MTTMTIDVVHDGKNAVLLYVRSNQTTLLTNNFVRMEMTLTMTIGGAHFL